MKVTPITLEQAQIVAEWRNECRQALRTGWTTQQQQANFVSTNMTGSHMYWAFTEGEYAKNLPQWPLLYGAGGLVNIDKRVRNAEIALIINPKERRNGTGTQCVEWILNEGFRTQNMKTIYGEVYACGAVAFWEKICSKYGATMHWLPNRQYWDGKYWDSMYFSIDREQYEQGS